MCNFEPKIFSIEILSLNLQSEMPYLPRKDRKGVPEMNTIHILTQINLNNYV